jgi:hypothetical protein
MPEEAGLTERWKLIASGQAFRLRNEHSGLVLEIGSANPNRGVQAIQWHDHETRTNQHWTFELVDDFYLIRPGHADFVLGISQGKMQDGARAIQWDYVRDVPDQLWELRSSDPVAAPQMPAPPVVDAPKTVATSTLLVAGLLGGVVLIVVIFALVGVVYWRRSRPVSHPSTENDAPKQASTSISLTCPGCQRILKPSATSVGKKVRCSKCGVAVLVPASAGSQ